jgi:hypothetical protein
MFRRVALLGIDISETLVLTTTTWRNIPDGGILQISKLAVCI